MFSVALTKPHFGAIILVSLLPIETILPQNLVTGVPLFTSPVSLVGGVVFVGAFLNAVSAGRLHVERIFTNVVQVAGLLFIAWFTLTHPQEAWSGSDRNYVFTFLQLWSLLWLAGTVLGDESHQRLLMIWFAAACALSAYATISGGQVAATREESLRSAGTMGGLNTAARYYVVGFVFLIYLRMQSSDTRLRWLAAVGAVFMLASVAFVQSRAGIGLALLSIMLLLPLGPKMLRRKYLVYLVGMILLAVLLIPTTLWESIGDSFFTEAARPRERFQSIDENIRYDLWYAGLEMWSGSPIQGIGIGQFPIQLAGYLPGLIPGKFGHLAAHNMYVRTLAETGIVGFGLFVVMILGALRVLGRARSPERDSQFQIARVWIIVLIVILAGGLLKDDYADKMFWLFLGIASSFGNSLRTQGIRRLDDTLLSPPAKSDAGASQKSSS